MIGLVGACSTGIGLAVPLIAACLGWMFGFEDTFALKVVVITVVTVVFAISVWVGLERGIKRLSNLAVWLAFALLGFVLITGPTVYILEFGTATIGFMLQNYITMSTWTDPARVPNFVESWTVFYWAWWLALGPFMGIFITKISGGRTIRQVILGSLGYGTLGTRCFSSCWATTPSTSSSATSLPCWCIGRQRCSDGRGRGHRVAAACRRCPARFLPDLCDLCRHQLRLRVLHACLVDHPRVTSR